MTDDLMKRLRDEAGWMQFSRIERMMNEAADEIERLRKELSEARAITSVPTYDGRTGELLFPKRNGDKHD